MGCPETSPSDLLRASIPRESSQRDSRCSDGRRRQQGDHAGSALPHGGRPPTIALHPSSLSLSLSLSLPPSPPGAKPSGRGCASSVRTPLHCVSGRAAQERAVGSRKEQLLERQRLCGVGMGPRCLESTRVQKTEGAKGKHMTKKNITRIVAPHASGGARSGP